MGNIKRLIITHVNSKVTNKLKADKEAKVVSLKKHKRKNIINWILKNSKPF